MSTEADLIGTLNGTWCKKCYGGSYVDLKHPKPEMVQLIDISFSLHNQCRYTGHVPFYSVAEHSVIAANLAISDGRSGDEVRAVLLHDAAEAYLGDISRPLKLYLRSVGVTIYDELTALWDEAIGQRFGVDLKAHHDVVKYYDNIMLKAEKTRFWRSDEEQWVGLDNVPDVRIYWLKCMPDDNDFYVAASFLGIR
jgi:uncharacterized protein